MIPAPSKIIQKERHIKLGIFLALALALALTIVLVHNMFVSFLLAFVTYYMMAPIVEWMERKGLSRTWATTLPFLALTLVIVAAILILTPVISDQLNSLQQNYKTYLDTVTNILNSLQLKANELLTGIYQLDLRSQVEPRLIGWTATIFQDLPNLISQSFTILILVPFLAYFMLLDGRDFVRKLLSFVPNNHFELALSLNHQISTQIGGFIRARFVESAIIAIFLWVGLLLIDFPYALILAVFAAVLNVIPYVGPVIGFLPALFISFANPEGGQMLWLFLIYLMAQVIDTVLLVPFLVAKIVDLHPVTVVIAILLGAQMMGILGMIICIPVVSTLKVSGKAIYRHITDFRE